MRRMLTAALLVFTAPSAAPAQAEAWWGHVTALADDSMRGRETGSPEHRRAAEYVAGAFQRAGLIPGGADGWFQPVRLQVRRIAEAPRSSHADLERQHRRQETERPRGVERRVRVAQRRPRPSRPERRQQSAEPPVHHRRAEDQRRHPAKVTTRTIQA